MGDIRDFHVASKFGSIESLAATDGEAGNANLVRELARNANRLALRGGPLVTFGWDASTDGTEVNVKGLRSLYLPTNSWSPIIPGPLLVPKPPDTTHIEIRAVVWLGGSLDDHTAWIRVNSSSTPSTAAYDKTSSNVVELKSTGSTLGGGGEVNAGWDTVTLSDIPVRRGAVLEPLNVLVKGGSTLELMDTDNSTGYGGLNTGTVGSVTIAYRHAASGGSELYVNGSNWHGPSNALPKKVLGRDRPEHVIKFTIVETSGTERPIYMSGSIFNTSRTDGSATHADGLIFYYPNMTEAIRRRLSHTTTTSKFYIYRANKFRIASLSIYAQDGVA